MIITNDNSKVEKGKKMEEGDTFSVQGRKEK